MYWLAHVHTMLLLLVIVRASEKDPQLAGLTPAVTNLGIRVLSAVRDVNVLLCPPSMAQVLGMLLLGAHGPTYKSLEAFLQLERRKVSRVHDAFKKLTVMLNLDQAEGISLQMASRAYVQNKVHQKYRRELRNFYGADIVTPILGTAFKEHANSWVSNATHGTIREIWTESPPEDASIVLLSAVFFKGSWKFKFKRQSTKLGKFLNRGHEEVLVPKMTISASFRFKFYGDLNACVLEIPYAGDRMAMYIFLPEQDGQLEEVEKTISAVGVSPYVSNMRLQKVTLLLPRFSLNSTIDLSTQLKALGLQGLFSDGADFSGISNGNLRVTLMMHRATVDVDELGSEASAASGVVITSRSLRARKTAIDVDRPFLFVIRDRTVNVDLFLARITHLPYGGQPGA